MQSVAIVIWAKSFIRTRQLASHPGRLPFKLLFPLVLKIIRLYSYSLFQIISGQPIPIPHI